MRSKVGIFVGLFIVTVVAADIPVSDLFHVNLSHKSHASLKNFEIAELGEDSRILESSIIAYRSTMLAQNLIIKNLNVERIRVAFINRANAIRKSLEEDGDALGCHSAFVYQAKIYDDILQRLDEVVRHSYEVQHLDIAVLINPLLKRLRDRFDCYLRGCSKPMKF